MKRKIQRRRQLEVKEEAIDRGIEPGSPSYLVFLALIRERGMSFDEAKAQMTAWDEEWLEAEEIAGGDEPHQQGCIGDGWGEVDL